MDHRNSVRPQVPQRPAASQPATEAHTSQRAHAAWSPSVEPPRRKKWPLFAAVGVVIVAILVASWFMFGRGVSPKVPATDRYQAVFLDNGQVFFGKLKNVDGEYLVLEEAYYTKKADVPEDATDEQKAAIEANVSLAKVGSEVYGPETTMSIRSEQVLFWQNLTKDSKVAQAIEKAED